MHQTSYTTGSQYHQPAYHETTESLIDQVLYYQTSSNDSRKKKPFFTAQQPDKSRELTNVKPLPVCGQLKVTTFNCKNIRTCGPIFEKLTKPEDIILVQEHWLFKCQLNLLEEINENVLVSGRSVDYHDPISPGQIPRGYGGVAIFWKKNIDHLVNSLENGN